MPTTVNAEELTAAVTPAVSFVSKRNAGTLLERVRLLREGGEAEERILARLNGPAVTGPLTDDPTPSRGDAGMSDLERRQRLERARRTTVAELADAVAERIATRMADQEERLDAHLRVALERLAVGTTNVERLAENPNADLVAAANAAAATTHDDTVPWETRQPADSLPGRASQLATLELLAHLHTATVDDVARETGLGYAGASSRLVHLLGRGCVQRRLVNGRYVYRVHPSVLELMDRAAS